MVVVRDFHEEGKERCNGFDDDKLDDAPADGEKGVGVGHLFGVA